MNLILIPRRGFFDEDLLNLAEIINQRFFIATKNREIAIGKYGTRVIPDFSIYEILKSTINAFDNLFIIADEGWKDLYDTDTKTLIARFSVYPRKIFAISLAPILLAKSGFLAGKIATYNNKDFPEYEKLFMKYGVRLVDFPVFKHENIITCKGRETLPLIKKYL